MDTNTLIGRTFLYIYETGLKYKIYIEKNFAS